jgi:hypothetical protein
MVDRIVAIEGVHEVHQDQVRDDEQYFPRPFPTDIQ